jgi:HK97 family phage prohead protease
MALLMSAPVNDPILLKGMGQDLVVAGYASVEMVDKQGDLITRGALRDAFGKFMKADGFRNVQLAHSNIQVGQVIPEYTDSSGRMWKSEVDDTGMFVVIKLRGDIEKAREVAAEIRKGNLRSFSIGGQAFERVNKHDSSRGDYREIRRMELHEVTICEKGINPEAQFRILKEDTSNNNGDNMTDPMTELNSVLERLSKRLEDVERAENEKMAYEDTKEGKMPKGLREHMEGKKSKKDEGEEKDPDSKDAAESEDEDEDDKKKDDDKMAKTDMDDVITTDYLQWLESTVKSAGYDPTAARNHFDDVEKGYGPGEDGASHRGQPPLGIVGEGTSTKKPNFGAGGKGNQTVIKGAEFVSPESVSSSDIEQAYEVYKAAAKEQHFKTDLGNYFETRLQKEMSDEANEAARQNFDSRAPLADLQKAVLSLSERIDNLNSGSGESFAKSDSSVQTIPVPDTSELARMEWDDVHRLANRALRGGE